MTGNEADPMRQRERDAIRAAIDVLTATLGEAPPYPLAQSRAYSYREEYGDDSALVGGLISVARELLDFIENRRILSAAEVLKTVAEVTNTNEYREKYGD